ncbi:aldo/keto reductase [Halanaerobium kushneri]|uniref:Predicted oxidoreductase n=1 Tax=Halanaerobium kushneri TaxID=56779 RepID=A0A1N6WP51_9FIRM|nr:aldo/keto reductase [Halanaerobium kushneri]SIQ91816.1 Predicted oxidoreductase [Halanaerobium kushneri]
MNYTTVGRTGIKVSDLCLGTMSFGGDADKETAKEMYRASREVGINFFDTANVYSGGKSEEILGECISEDKREEIILTTKMFYPMSKDLNAMGASRRNIIREVEGSLKRLGTDYIDFYFVHMFDQNTPIEETLRALDQLQKDGKILYPAVSNWAAWQIATALGISAKESLARFELIQPMYNLAKRQAETEILPLAEAHNLGVISYSPLGGGLLTGKYGVDKKPAKGRLVDQERYSARYHDKINYEVAEKFTQYAADKNVHPVTLAVAWVKSNPAVTAPIIAGRNLEQLKDSLAAAEFEMSAEMRKEISELSPTPAPATDRAEVLFDEFE